MIDQTVQIKYIGTEQRWPELSITGRQSVWMPGQIESRSTVEAASLLATGLFSSPPVPVLAETGTGGGVEIFPEAARSAWEAPLSELSEDLYAVVDVDIALVETSVEVYAVSAAKPPMARPAPFAGWCAIYNRLPDVEFNAVRLPEVHRAASVTDPNHLWSKVVLTVHNGDQDAPALATAEVEVEPSSAILTDLVFRLRTPSGSQNITLTEADLPSQYAISYAAYNATGGRAVCGEMRGAIQNFAGMSFYMSLTLESWLPYAGSHSLAIESLLFTTVGVKSYSIKVPVTVVPPEGVDLTKSTHIVCPSKVFAVEGREASVYFDNLTYHRASEFLWDVNCAVGIHQSERFVFQAGGAGTHPLTVIAIDPITYNVVGQKTMSLVVAPAAAKPATSYRCLCIGDSTTANGMWVTELKNIAESDVLDITLVGTQGTSGNSHEGYSGRTTSWFHSHPDSPFVFGGSFDFAQYMTSSGFSPVDFVFVHLGINDVFGQTTDAGAAAVASQAVTAIEAMANSVKSFDSGTKFCVMLTIPPSGTQDAMGDSYGAGQNLWRYRRNNIIFVQALIDAFDSREASGIFVVPVNLNMDVRHNYPSSTVAANSRTTNTVTRQANGVHPSADGYAQMADAVFAFLKAV